MSEVIWNNVFFFIFRMILSILVWNACFKSEQEPENCTVYSFGVADNWSFDAAGGRRRPGRGGRPRGRGSFRAVRAFDRLAKNPETGERDPNRQFSGKEINQFLREIAAEFGRELAGDRFDLNGEIGASLRVRLNKLAKDTEFTSFGQTRSALETLGLDLGPEPPTIDITAMPTFSKRPVQLRQFKERKLAFGFIPWRIRYPFGAVEGRFEMDMPGELKAIFDERVRQWIERIKARYYRACFETRFQPMMRHLENLIAEQARRSQEAATEEREALHVTEVVNPNLEELESLVDLCTETNVFPATSEK